MNVPSSIVVRSTNWVGDTVMSIPALRRLRRTFPDSRIVVCAPAGLEKLLMATAVPDGFIAVDSQGYGPVRRSLVMGKTVKAGNFDMAVLFQNAFEAAFTCFLARIPVRAGYPTDLRGPLLTIKIPLAPEIQQKHQTFYYLGITDFLHNLWGKPETSGPNRPDCSIPLSSSAFDRGRELMAEAGVALEGPFYCLCPGSVNSNAKRWPADYFAELADLIDARLGASVVFLGAAQEQPLINDIILKTRVQGAKSIAGKADMITSMAVMALSRMVVSNDTGSAHLAVAAGAAVLTLFGPTSVGATAPFGPTAYTIQGKAPCAPCRYFHCPRPDHLCMRSVSPKQVVDEVIKIGTMRADSAEPASTLPR